MISVPVVDGRVKSGAGSPKCKSVIMHPPGELADSYGLPSRFHIAVFKSDGVSANELPQPFQGHAEVALSTAAECLAWFEP